ncbi:MAG: family 2A encapsulin nanocompartment cargo protein cysteine desulfurase [Polyangiaceae bacterium]
MTTPDPKSAGGSAIAPPASLGEVALPAELVFLSAQAPRSTETIAHPAPAAATPGVGLAGARYPGQPTLPDFDPVALTQAVARLANELFAAPPSAPGIASAPAIAPETPAALGGAPSALPSVTPSVAVVEPLAVPTVVTPPPASLPSVANPFAAPLDFDAVARAGQEFGAPMHPPDAALWSLLRPVEARPFAPEEPAPPAPALTFDAFEITPAADPAIRNLGRDPFDPHAVRREVPILEERVRGRKLVWLDNAATTQKPRAVIDRLKYFYEHENSNVHRAAHTLAARATDAYEAARETVQRFIKASSSREIVFVRGTTEGINLVAQSWGRRNIGPGDEIVITWLEHHANIVPWQLLCAEKGARLKVAPVDDKGEVILDEYEKLLGPKVKLVSFTQVSNALGTVTPAREMIEMAHRHGALVLLDGAQSVAHMPVDVQELACDFFVFSGHKIFAPTGIGAVYGRRELLDAMPPWQGGGNMIEDVTFERTRFHPAPARFEAGTGNIADAVGLGAALDWLSRIGVERAGAYEHGLLEYASRELDTVPGLHRIGHAKHRAGVVSFILDGQKTEEVGGLLDQEGIAVRSGHHCAQPILRRFGLEATVRASFAPYNTCEDVDALVAALKRIQAGR